MSDQHATNIRGECDLVARFAEAYRRQIATVVARLNAPSACARTNADDATLRLCVESVDMILDLQSRLASAVAHLSSRP